MWPPKRTYLGPRPAARSLSSQDFDIPKKRAAPAVSRSTSRSNFRIEMPNGGEADRNDARVGWRPVALSPVKTSLVSPITLVSGGIG